MTSTDTASLQTSAALASAIASGEPTTTTGAGSAPQPGSVPAGLLKELVDELGRDGNISKADINVLELFLKLASQGAPGSRPGGGGNGSGAPGSPDAAPRAPITVPSGPFGPKDGDGGAGKGSITVPSGPFGPKDKGNSDGAWLKGMVDNARADGRITDNESEALGGVVDSLQGKASGLSVGEGRQMLVDVMKDSTADGKFSDQDLGAFQKIAPLTRDNQAAAPAPAPAAAPTLAPAPAPAPAPAASAPSGPSARMKGGKAVFENDNYRITANDDSEVNITNKRTGETYRAWGDPHMDIDGKHEFDFWGTTTLALDDGTKVTIETTPWKHDPSQTLSSKVSITSGDYAAQFSGVDGNATGDLKLEEFKGGAATLDKAVADGNVLFENRGGKGFVAADAKGNVRSVDRAFMDETDLLKGGKAGGQIGAGEQVKRTMAVLMQDGRLTGEESKQIESIVRGLAEGSIDNASGRGLLGEVIKGSFNSNGGMDAGEAKAFDSLRALVQGPSMTSQDLTNGINAQVMSAYLFSPFMSGKDVFSTIAGTMGGAMAGAGTGGFGGIETEEQKANGSQKS